MGIFTDIYNTVAKFFRQSDEPVIGDASKAVAANRLRLVLMQDRTNLTPRVLEQMRSELVDLLSKYLEMDKELLELNFEQEGDQVALMLSIPVIRAKDEDEIEAALSTSEENEEEVISEESEDEEVADSEESNEEPSSEQASEEAPKPKRRRPKKVTPPEEIMGATNEANESETSEEHHEIAEIEG
jgi:cell division topological specificity factor